MIAGIISTIIMALGIATGNVSSNVYKGGNVFHDKEKSQPKKALEQTTYLQEYNLTNIQRIQYTETWNTDARAEKWYLGENNTVPHVYTQFLDVYNTLYNYEEETNYVSDLYIIGIIQINNYTDTSMNDIYLKLYLRAYANNSDSNYFSVTKIVRTYYYNQLENLIDQTITNKQSVIDIKNNLLSADYNHQLIDTVISEYGTPIDPENGYRQNAISPETSITINYLEAHSNVQIGYYLKISKYIPSGNRLYYRMTGSLDIEITGTPIIGDINYEVIDVPGIMFTILSMPFSFISTAFNLTIFPGTPYQINFANLFMVLLATFILAWIIRKVFH